MFDFIKKLFGSKSANQQSSQKQQRKSPPRNKNKKRFEGILQTNAPDHWPQLEINWGVQTFPGDYQNAMLASLMYNAKIVETLSSFHKVEKKTSYAENIDLVEGPVCGSSSIQQLTKEGIIILSAAIRENGKKYPVIIFEQEINQFTIDKANELLKPYNYQELIWYAPAQPNQGTKNLLTKHKFGANSLRPIKDYQSKFANYAMWWSSPQESKFTNSSACQSISQFYEEIQNYETAINGLFGVMLKMHPKIDYVSLPKDLLLPIHGPGNEVILLRVSKERGFNFFFPVNERMSVYRDDFLREMSVFIKESLTMLKQNKYKAQTKQSQQLNWWKNRLEAQKIKEEQDANNKLLSIFEPVSQGNPINN